MQAGASDMNPWLDAIVKNGVAVVCLYVVSRALWPLVLKFIDKWEAIEKASRERGEAVQDKADQAAALHYAWAQKISSDFAQAMGQYNQANAETVRQLGVIANILAKGDQR